MDVELVTLKTSKRKVMKRPTNNVSEKKVIRVENEDDIDSGNNFCFIYRSREETLQKEREKAYNKKYWENREAKIEYQKRYNVEVRDMKSYNKSYYEQHKEEIIERMTKKVNCSCGKIVTFGNLKSHYKTSIHKKRLINQNNMII
jgi:hypothetical protein